MSEIGDLEWSFEIQCNTEENESRDLIRDAIHSAIDKLPTLTIRKTEWDSVNGYVEAAGLYQDSETRNSVFNELIPLTQKMDTKEIIDINELNEPIYLVVHHEIDPKHVYHRYCLEDKEYMAKCKNCGMHIRINGKHFENTECDAPVTIKEQITIPLDPTKPISSKNFQIVDSDKPLIENVVVKSIENEWGNPTWKIMKDGE